MAGEGGTVIALQVAPARRRLTQHFLSQHAIGPGDAVAYVPDRAFDGEQFAKMRARGIIHATPSGHYWLDLPALKADEEARRRFLVPIVIALVLVAVAVLMFQYRG